MAMDRLLAEWHAVANWALGQPVIVQVAVGSAVLLLAYVLFVVVLTMLMWLSGKYYQSNRRQLKKHELLG